MGMIQTILIALIPIAFLVWRFRRLMAVLQGGRSMTYKIVIGGVMALLIVLRVARLTSLASASASPADDKPVEQAGHAAAAKAPTGRLLDAMTLLSSGQHALEKCDTATANLAFQRASGVGVEMMTADSLAGDPLYVQGFALAGLRDSASAIVLATEADRLDKKRGEPANPERMTSIRHMIALARRKC